MLLVVGQGQYAVDVFRTALEPMGQLLRLGAFVAPAQQSTLERSQPGLLLRRAPPRELRKDEHPLDEVAASVKAKTDLTGRDTGRGEAAHATFQRSEIRVCLHGPTVLFAAVWHTAPIRSRCVTEGPTGRTRGWP